MDNGYYHKSNPFLGAVNEFMGEVYKESRREVYLMDNTSGELLNNPGTQEYAKLVYTKGIKAGLSDKQPYIKIFTSGLQSLMKLSGPGTKVFLWIVGNVKPKQDKVILVPLKVASELGYAVTKPVHNAINDLIANGVIARAYTGNRNAPAYWINPTIFYNGNRRHLYKKKEL